MEKTELRRKKTGTKTYSFDDLVRRVRDSLSETNPEILKMDEESILRFCELKVEKLLAF